jgi:hypothetical protein
MYDAFDSRYIPLPDFEDNKSPDISHVSSFIHKRLIASINSFTTAIDSTERQEITADMIVCCSALSLLSLSLQTENNLLIDSAKELMRKLK